MAIKPKNTIIGAPIRATRNKKMPNGNGGMSPEARDNIQVLAQRVTFTESAISEIRSSIGSLNEKMDSQARTSGEKIDTLFRSLDQRLSTQIDSISRELGKQVEAVNEKVNTGRIPNYAVVLGFLVFIVTLFGTMYAFVLTPVNNGMAEIRTVISNERLERTDAIQDIQAHLVPREEVAEKSRIIERDIDSVRNDIDALDKRFVTREEIDVSRARSQEDRERWNMELKDLRTTGVTRAEWSERNGSRDHEVAAIQTAMNTMKEDFQRQIDQQSKATSDLSTSLGNGGDSIRTMREQIERLQEYILKLVSANPRNGLTVP